MKNLLKLDEVLNFSKKMTIIALLTSMLSTIASLSYGVYLQSKLSRPEVFILDENAVAFSAIRLTNELNFRDPEIINHLKTFHHYFFNLDQNNFEMNLEKALNLIGESGKNYYLTLESEGWYQNLKLNNVIQELEIDSINVNSKIYPYTGSVYGKTFVYRYGLKKEGHVKTIAIKCILYNVARTTDNPHGLMIDKYDILYHE